MTTQELKTILESITGFSNKVAYFVWESNVPALPYICFFTPSSNSFSADNITYHQSKNFRIELYTKRKDEATEKLVEDKLTYYDIYFTKESDYLEDEKCWMTLYEITL